jgi:hypothetical protein
MRYVLDRVLALRSVVASPVGEKVNCGVNPIRRQHPVPPFDRDSASASVDGSESEVVSGSPEAA